jgi:hypothetical protein
MPFYPKTVGVEGYRFAKTKEECFCFICREMIEKGVQRFVKYNLNLCVSCKDAWYREGGMLYKISRSKVQRLNNKDDEK